MRKKKWMKGKIIIDEIQEGGGMGKVEGCGRCRDGEEMEGWRRDGGIDWR